MLDWVSYFVVRMASVQRYNDGRQSITIVSYRTKNGQIKVLSDFVLYTTY